ncbi:cyclin-D1-1-like [Oryza brachyantha]|uniref:cyclin-D1-1-like n=1 Tax=Oryza brachyantha TaxID=4533 RepID=UPI001AD99342|nr:cyclin-D1-1-like [Oryza brachyantha]
MDDNGDDALLYCGEDAGELERDDREPGTSSSSTCTAAAADDGGHGECFCYDDDDDAPVDTEFVVPAFSPPGRRPGAVVHRPGSWSESVSWILKVRSFHGFQPATAYLAVSYMDRFLSSRTLPDYGWASQLLCVACLSLAAKMEETSSPPLLNLQIEGTRFIFEPRTIQRMELIVLVELDWRLRSLTPFAFVDFFAFKAGSSGRNSRILALRTCQIILDAIHETEFLNHCASSMAAAAVLLAVNESPAAMACRSVSPESVASWCVGLTEEGISSCYQLLQQQQALNTARERRRHLMILLAPQLRPMNCSSVASSSSRGKRRKLGGHFGEE